MTKGVFIALGIFVNCIWGTAFLIPYILPEANPMIIAFGRYVFYGLVSLSLILMRRNTWKKLSTNQWFAAFLLGFAGNVGYYLFLTSSIYYSGITISALIIGVLPVALIIAGNIVEKAYSFKSLVLPVVIILGGMLTLGLGKIESSQDDTSLLIGALFAFIALGLWTYYGVKNARFLKENPDVSSNSWSLAIGICCLVQSLVALPVLGIFTDAFDFSGNTSDYFLLKIMTGCLFLGIVVSWLATILWNQASRHLPVALAGQLIVFETLSSLLYGFIADSRLPTVSESAAIVLVIFGVTLGLRATKQKNATEALEPCPTAQRGQA